MDKAAIKKETLTEIADAIRSKTNEEGKLSASDMAAKIETLPNVDAPVVPEECFTFTGKIRYIDYQGRLSVFLTAFKDKIKFIDVEDAYGCFENSKVKELPDLHFIDSPISLSRLFLDAMELRKAPYVYATPSSWDEMFEHCFKLTEIPEDWAGKINWDSIRSVSNSYISSVSSPFASCYCLRHIPQSLVDELWTNKGDVYSFYSNMVSKCRVLDKINNVPITPLMDSDTLSQTCVGASRLKSFTFAVNADGTPKTAKWKKQVFRLTNDKREATGSADAFTYITDYSDVHGITQATRVTDDESYQRLKDDPDWWTRDPAYSRYDKASAIETINSLPDTSAYLAEQGGTNTITFLGTAGSKTDAGAINTMTEEEIAVATAKGWTVTFV